MGGVIALPKLFKQAQASEAAKSSPTVAEVSQSSATSADGYDLRKQKQKEDQLQLWQALKVYQTKL